MPPERIGRYELGRVLGVGGAGRVYEATLIGPGGFRKPVALKVLHDGAASLRREARIGGLLRHRNIVDVYEIGEADGQWFCALERCVGSLASRLPLPPRAVVEVGLQVCAALQYAHEDLGLVHLDLKPDNLLLGPHGAVKVADLGIARADGFAERSSRVRGTAGFMAPEQQAGLAVDARADQYALGVTLVQLATGELLGADGTLDLDSLDAPLATDAPAIPPWLAPAVDRCLEPLADDRWPDMDALAAALRQLDPGGPGLAEFLGLDDGEPPPPTDTNLPSSQPDVYGRTDETRAALEGIQRGAIVTIKGPAGVGKSRLAEHAARTWHRDRGGEAWRIDLANVHDEAGLLGAVARTLGVSLGQSDPAGQLGHALASRGRLLLVFDNFEHVAHLAPTLSSWRERATDVRFLATSRIRLDLDDEQVLELGPLPSEAAGDLVRARARARGVELDASDDLTELVTRLEGLPLALELAAGRLGILSVRDVLDRLDQGVLRRGTDDRHGTLQAALEWSWELLSAKERAAMAQLSVFSGGFTLEAAEQVVLLDGGSVLDTLAELVDHSMVHSTASGRFSMLLSVQTHAAGKLDDALSAEERHGRHYARQAEQLIAAQRRQIHRRHELVPELANLLAACRRAIRRSDGATAIATMEGAAAVFDLRGPLDAAIALVDEVLTMPGLVPEQRVHAQAERARVTHYLGGTDQALTHFDAAVALAEQVGDPTLTARVVRLRAEVYRDRYAFDEARSGYTRALSHFEAEGLPRDAAIARSGLAILAWQEGRLDEAEVGLQAVLDEHLARGRRILAGHVAKNLGHLCNVRGDLAKAAELFQLSIDTGRELGDDRMVAHALGNLAGVHVGAGDVPAARRCLEASLDVVRRCGERATEGTMLGNLSYLLRVEGDLEQALETNAASQAILREVGNMRHLSHQIATQALLLEGLDRPDEARAAWSSARELARSIGYGRFEGHSLGQLARGTDDVDEAGALLDQGEALLREAGDPILLSELLTVRAALLWRTGEAERARSTLAEAEELLPEGHQEGQVAVERVRQLMAR